jgi:hypothetical protein
LTIVQLQSRDPFENKPLNLDLNKETGASKSRKRSSRSRSKLRKSSKSSRSREKLNDSMYDLPIQKGKIDDHSTSGTRLPVYQSDNDIYSSEKKISKDKEEQDFRKLKDG